MVIKHHTSITSAITGSSRNTFAPWSGQVKKSLYEVYYLPNCIDFTNESQFVISNGHSKSDQGS